jgi:phosphatidate cytidylyltransferase
VNPEDAAAPKPSAGVLKELLPRTLSALVLIPIGLGAAIYGGPWMAGAAGGVALAAAYEWARMSEPEATAPAFLFALVGALGAVMVASWDALPLGLGWLAACAALSAFRRRTLAGVIETAGGALYVGAPPALFVWLRGLEPGGFAFIMLIFSAIWAADVAAYFVGTLVGGPKVHRALSPQKTWSGLLGGTLAGAGAAAVAALFFEASAPLWAEVGAVLAMTGLAGDLFESALKRRFNVKDSSRFIPGHGGVLDRLDGCMAATLLASAVLAIWPGFGAMMLP